MPVHVSIRAIDGKIERARKKSSDAPRLLVALQIKD